MGLRTLQAASEALLAEKDTWLAKCLALLPLAKEQLREAQEHRQRVLEGRRLHEEVSTAV